jgi:hypothetical protein
VNELREPPSTVGFALKKKKESRPKRSKKATFSLSGVRLELTIFGLLATEWKSYDSYETDALPTEPTRLLSVVPRPPITDRDEIHRD